MCDSFLQLEGMTTAEGIRLRKPYTFMIWLAILVALGGVTVYFMRDALLGARWTAFPDDPRQFAPSLVLYWLLLGSIFIGNRPYAQRAVRVGALIVAVAILPGALTFALRYQQFSTVISQDVQGVVPQQQVGTIAFVSNGGLSLTQPAGAAVQSANIACDDACVALLLNGRAKNVVVAWQPDVGLEPTGRIVAAAAYRVERRGSCPVNDRSVSKTPRPSIGQILTPGAQARIDTGDCIIGEVRNFIQDADLTVYVLSIAGDARMPLSGTIYSTDARNYGYRQISTWKRENSINTLIRRDSFGSFRYYSFPFSINTTGLLYYSSILPFFRQNMIMPSSLLQRGQYDGGRRFYMNGPKAYWANLFGLPETVQGGEQSMGQIRDAAKRELQSGGSNSPGSKTEAYLRLLLSSLQRPAGEDVSVLRAVVRSSRLQMSTEITLLGSLTRDLSLDLSQELRQSLVEVINDLGANPGDLAARTRLEALSRIIHFQPTRSIAQLRPQLAALSGLSDDSDKAAPAIARLVDLGDEGVADLVAAINHWLDDSVPQRGHGLGPFLGLCKAESLPKKAGQALLKFIQRDAEQGMKGPSPASLIAANALLRTEFMRNFDEIKADEAFRLRLNSINYRAALVTACNPLLR
jgi:hypothetical protein